MSTIVGVIGGSGLYELLDGAVEHAVTTPYGAPSSTLSTGQIGGRDVAFITRHGRAHELAPHTINYRANLWALHDMGARTVITSSAVGSLKPDVQPGEFVLCDQFIDRTSGRIDTFYEGPKVVHVSVADPYCPELRARATEVMKRLGERYHPTGTAVVIQGPRFSTRAESRWFQQMGWDVLSMTQHPETALARELAMCCLNVSFVSDHDAGVTDDAEPVRAGDVWRRMAENQGRIRAALAALIVAAPDIPTCRCRDALSDV
ncbi:S-methyl-5'-thioadenosine phosphorylase [Cellulomonas fimi]|uniref:S-methyl-5'-thioadenosine phosphorylase n=1 Tax=Cellulomonas fimi TaxID=1708 RepID=A0A7Y0LYV1_CELFI|nr:S-methyl-5'-thioadenosine phosphorylase [Cellulomonas fimi]NMR19252.1 S-methyl-5'-thioadenosine phosphorylase [Cellulomonas fimi]